MSLFVQKYGGTSLRDLPSRKNLISHAKKCIEGGNKLVIVVSAMGRKGDPYATDTLIEELKKINNEIDPKKKDLIMSCGETISTSVIAHLLDTEGIPCEALMGFQAGILTDSNFNSSEIIDINVSKILKYIKTGKVVVVAGFQGSNINGEITTLGRGGSDTTAVTLGGYLKAERVDIFTDVPGVAIVDPNIVPNTKYIENISYDDMYNLADNGVKVIHPRAVLAGKKFNIPIKIRSTYLGYHGTLISHEESQYPRKIIGIALQSGEDKGIISILFKKDYRIELQKKLKTYLVENATEILDVQWHDHKVCLLVDPNKVNFYGKKLYHYFFD